MNVWVGDGSGRKLPGRDGDINNPANWSKGCVPSVGDTVYSPYGSFDGDWVKMYYSEDRGLYMDVHDPHEALLLRSA